MSTPAASSLDPSWLVEGTLVAVVTGSQTRQSYSQRTVVKLTKTTVVLDDETRFRRDGLSRRGGSTWDPHSYIYEINSDEAVRARAVRDLRAARNKARATVDEFTAAIGQLAYDEALPDPADLIREIQRLHSASLAAAFNLQKDS